MKAPEREAAIKTTKELANGSAEFVAGVFVEGQVVNGAHGDQKQSEENKNEQQADAQNISGGAAVAMKELLDQGKGENGKDGGAGIGAEQNHPIGTCANLRPHAPSDRVATVSNIIARAARPCPTMQLPDTEAYIL